MCTRGSGCLKITKFECTYFMDGPLPKSQQEFFAAQKSLRDLKLLRVIIDKLLIKFHSDRVFYNFLSDNVLFESSVMGSSSGSSVIDSYLGSPVLFFWHAAIFYQNELLLFLLKTDVLFYIKFSKRSLHLTISLTCFNNFNKADIKKMKNICTIETKYCIKNICYQFPDL